jgi:hypothetical protein
MRGYNMRIPDDGKGDGRMRRYIEKRGNMMPHFYMPVNNGYRTGKVKNYYLKPSKVYTKWFKIGKVKLMISFPLFWR